MGKGKVGEFSASEVRSAAIYAAGWFVCAMIALELTQGEDGIAAVWPPSGIFVAALLHMGARGRKLTSSGVALASIVANMWAGSGFFASFGYTIANLIEGWLVFFLMDRGRFRHMLLARPANLIRFAISAIIGGIASTVMAGALSGNFDTVFLTSWMSTVTLGMLIVTPVIMFLIQDQHHETGIFTFRGFWTFVLVALTALAAFGQSDIPLLVLPIVAISITTAALGLTGAVLALLLVATIGSVLTALNLGPVGIFFPPVENQVLFFQVYLLALLVSTLPVALSLAQHRRDLQELATSKRMLEAAERAAKVGHWRHDPATDTIYWSEEAGRMLARTPLPVSLDEMVEMFHQDDRERISRLLVTAEETGIPFTFEARIDRFDGTPGYFECRNQVETSSQSGPPVIFGTIMDVTERAERMREMHRARMRAEHEVAEVRILAETDYLTGIPNRRKILSELATQVAQAISCERDLSIAMLDIDHFKSINDRFGHEAGDQTLIKVSEALKCHLLSGEMIGRMGGEEFLAIFPGCDAESVRQRCLAIGPAMGSVKWPEAGMEPVTVSIGIAQFDHEWSDDRLLRAADDALYLAKRNGRARCAVYVENAQG